MNSSILVIELLLHPRLVLFPGGITAPEVQKSIPEYCMETILAGWSEGDFSELLPAVNNLTGRTKNLACNILPGEHFLYLSCRSGPQHSERAGSIDPYIFLTCINKN